MAANNEKPYKQRNDSIFYANIFDLPIKTGKIGYFICQLIDLVCCITYYMNCQFCRVSIFVAEKSQSL